MPLAERGSCSANLAPKEKRMQFLIVLLSAIVAMPQILSWPSSRPAGIRSDPVLVRTVFGGDSIDVAAVGRVRLIGIDVPDIGSGGSGRSGGRGFATPAPFAIEARARLTDLLLHRWVRLEEDVQRLDVYNRHLAYVMTDDGLFVNAVLVREGLARVSARTPLKRLDELKAAEREAQGLRRGIWGHAPGIPSTGYTPPAKAALPKAKKAAPKAPPKPSKK
jgi:micrococcal nuclease